MRSLAPGSKNPAYVGACALLASTLVLLLGLGWSAEASVSRDTARALALRLDLPATSFEYESVQAAVVSDRRSLRRFDNTPRSNPITNAGATLGRVLFYDPLLSSTGKISCASCHQQRHAFADAKSRSRGVHGRRGRRNSMALANLRYHPTGRFFWDQRAPSLEEQVLQPIQDPDEMNLPLDRIPERLALRADYGPLFKAAFGDTEITADRTAKALAQFLRSMTSFRSPYDEGLAAVGDVSKEFPNFSKLENEGKDLFFTGLGRASCARCHVADARGGPRRFRDGSPSTPILFSGRSPSNNGLDKKLSKRDGGVGVVLEDESLHGAFKVPSLRNIELTAPYMHDGRLKTLDSVVRHYNQRVQPHPTLDRRLQGRRGAGAVRLNLNSRERRALVAFMKTLTDNEFQKDPRFGDPFR